MPQICYHLERSSCSAMYGIPLHEHLRLEDKVISGFHFFLIFLKESIKFPTSNPLVLYICIYSLFIEIYREL